METVIYASSPLFQYSPCQSCPSGWTPSPLFFNTSTNISNYGLVTAQAATVELNFTGTGMTLNATSGSIWNIILRVNGTVQNSSNQATNLPWGAHTVHIDVSPNSTTSTSDSWYRFDGVSIALGALVGAGSTNGTIDDTAWRDWKVDLSPGWNMLEQGESNWINQTQMQLETANIAEFYNGSVSWTEQAGANSTIAFNGTAVWVYGVTGPDTGRYSVMLDNSTVTYNANSELRSYGALLYQTSGLEDTEHILTLINLDQGKRLWFDKLEYRSGLLTTPFSGSSPLPSDTTSSLATTSGRSHLSRGAVAGIAIGTVAAIALITVLSWALFARKKIHQAISKETSNGLPPSPVKPNNSFWRWSGTTGMTGHTARSRPSAPPEPDRPFVPLREKNIPNLGTAVYRINTPSPPPNLPQPGQHTTLGTSFLKLSKSPKKAQESAIPDDAVPPIPARPEYDADLSPSIRLVDEMQAYKTNALRAALNDTASPLSSLRDSFFTRIGTHRLAKKGTNRSISVKTTMDDEDLRPPTPGGILDGYFSRESRRSFGMMQSEDGRLGPQWEKEESKLPSMGERKPRRVLSKILGDGRPESGESSKVSDNSGWR